MRVFLSLILLVWMTPLFAQKILVVTEEFPPYNYSFLGEVRGVSTRVIHRVLEKAHLDYEIRVYPWPRAYQMALKGTNVMIYSIVRSQERESLFKWGGRIADINTVFLKLKKRRDIVFSNDDDFQKYRIGVLARSARALYLKEHGFTNVSYSYKTGGLDLLRLYYERVDVILFDMESMRFWIDHDYRETRGISRRDFEVLYVVQELSGGMEFAFGKATDDAIVNMCKAALESLKKSGEFDRILKEGDR